MSKYTSKVVFHHVANSQKIKHIQLFTDMPSALHWCDIQVNRGFTPAYAEDNTVIDTGMHHIGDTCPQVHDGHYSNQKGAAHMRFHYKLEKKDIDTLTVLKSTDVRITASTECTAQREIDKVERVSNKLNSNPKHTVTTRLVEIKY